MSRRVAREYTIQFLFSMDFNKSDDTDKQFEEFLLHMEEHKYDDEAIINKSSKDYAVEITKGTLQHIDEIDKLIELHTTGWKKERIAKVDLAILRLAIYEIVFTKDVPDSVAANEAIELAKKFSTDESGSFVNGVLGKIIRGKDEQGI
ncbi:MAG: transcription antitermination factor NusB [Clostridiales bacterium GWB2_37_7]|nr:MAG: transcription antitermination factor NusB [Clostridiales bacterium GWB2_37_7]